jgi:hypothetical protein
VTYVGAPDRCACNRGSASSKDLPSTRLTATHWVLLSSCTQTRLPAVIPWLLLTWMMVSPASASRVRKVRPSEGAARRAILRKLPHSAFVLGLDEQRGLSGAVRDEMAERRAMSSSTAPCVRAMRRMKQELPPLSKKPRSVASR